MYCVLYRSILCGSICHWSIWMNDCKIWNNFLYSQQISISIMSWLSWWWPKVCTVNRKMANLVHEPHTRNLYSSIIFSRGHWSREFHENNILFHKAIPVWWERKWCIMSYFTTYRSVPLLAFGPCILLL